MGVAEFPLHVVRNTFCAFVFMHELQHQLGDLRGAIASEAYDLCRSTARAAIFTCLSIRSAAVSGNIASVENLKSGTFDPFIGNSPQVVGEALEIVRRGARAAEPAHFARWLADVEAFVRETEKILILDQSLPELRSERGIFSILRIGRRWVPLAKDIGLPDIILKEWV